MEDKKLVIPAPVSASGDDVTTWALPKGAIARLGQGLVETLAFSADGNYLAIGTRVGLWLYEVATMDRRRTYGQRNEAYLESNFFARMENG